MNKPITISCKARVEIPHRLPTKAEALSQLNDMGLLVTSVIDVGVMTGTPPLIQLYHDKMHLLIEPVEEFQSEIKSHYANTNHILVNAAALDRDGETWLQVIPAKSGGIKASHAMNEPPSEQAAADGTPVSPLYAESRRVPCGRLDSIVRRWSLEPPYLLKIDVDGRELDVLRGAKETLGGVSCVVLEATVANFAQRMTYLTAEGFVLWDIVDLCYRNGCLWQVDLIMIKGTEASRFAPEFERGDPDGWLPLTRWFSELRSTQVDSIIDSHDHRQSATKKNSKQP